MQTCSGKCGWQIRMTEIIVRFFPFYWKPWIAIIKKNLKLLSFCPCRLKKTRSVLQLRVRVNMFNNWICMYFLLLIDYMLNNTHVFKSNLLLWRCEQVRWGDFILESFTGKFEGFIWKILSFLYFVLYEWESRN